MKLGDRVDVGGIRGDVVDVGALTTTILELGPGPGIHQATGRLVSVPNSLFSSQSFANESFAGNFVFHTFVVPLNIRADWKAAERSLLEATRVETAAYEKDALRALARFSDERNVDHPTAEARVWVRIVDPERLELTVRFVAPARLRGRLEQAIVRRFLESWPSPSAEA